MKKKTRFTHPFLALVLILAVILSACGQAAPTQEMTMKEASPEPAMEMKEKEAQETAMPGKTQDEMMAESSLEDMMDEEMPQSEMAQHTPETMDTEGEGNPEAMMRPAWHKASLTDVCSEQTFTLADFKGKVVLVETMAVWCSNCLRQQKQVKALHEKLGARDDFVSLGLDIDPNEDAAALKEFIEKQGFDWLYAVAPVDVGREIGQLYGDQFLNPPSTPMLIIDRHGEVHTLSFGVKRADDLYVSIKSFLEDSV